MFNNVSLHESESLTPWGLAVRLKHAFSSQPTHQHYLTKTGDLSPLLYKGQQSLIFFPITDKLEQPDSAYTISELMKKCKKEFTNLYYLEAKNINFLIFPLALKDSKHWITAIFIVNQEKMLFLDSIPCAKKDCMTFMLEFNQVFSDFDITCKTFDYRNQWLQFNQTDCGYWTLANIQYVDQYGEHASNLLQISKYSETLPASEQDMTHPIESKPEQEDDFEELVNVAKREEIPYETSMRSYFEKWKEEILAQCQKNITNPKFILKTLIDRQNINFQGSKLTLSTCGRFSLSHIIEDLNTKQVLFDLFDKKRQLVGYEDKFKDFEPSQQAIFEAIRFFAGSELIEKYNPRITRLEDNGLPHPEFNSSYDEFSVKIDQEVIALIQAAYPNPQTFITIASQWSGRDEIIIEPKLSYLAILWEHRRYHLLRASFELGLGLALVKYTPQLLQFASIQLAALNYIIPIVIIVLACLDLAYQSYKAKGLVDNSENIHCVDPQSKKII